MGKWLFKANNWDTGVAFTDIGVSIPVFKKIFYTVLVNHNISHFVILPSIFLPKTFSRPFASKMLWRSLIHFFSVAAGIQSAGLLKTGVHEPFLTHFMPFSLAISPENFSGAFRGYRKRPVARCVNTSE